MKNLLCAVLILISLSGFSQKKECDCAKYRTGTFYILNDRTPDDTCFVRRTATTQEEWIPNKLAAVTFQVIWIKKCTYLIRDRNLVSTKKYHFNDVVAKIIETGRDYYVVKAWMPRGKKTLVTLHVYNPEF